MNNTNGHTEAAIVEPPMLRHEAARRRREATLGSLVNADPEVQRLTAMTAEARAELDKARAATATATRIAADAKDGIYLAKARLDLGEGSEDDVERAEAAFQKAEAAAAKARDIEAQARFKLRLLAEKETEQRESVRARTLAEIGDEHAEALAACVRAFKPAAEAALRLRDISERAKGLGIMLGGPPEGLFVVAAAGPNTRVYKTVFDLWLEKLGK